MTISRVFPHHDEVIAMFELLKATWIREDPRSTVAVNFAAYHETFLDMARAVVEARHATENEALTVEERQACALAVAHLIDKHDFDVIVGESGSRVELVELFDKLTPPSLAPATPTTEGGTD